MTNELAKKIRIMTDVIMPHNKWYRDNSKYVLNNITDFNIPTLVEKTIAKLGGHKVVDEYGYDLSDGSEIKTCSVSTFWKINKNGNKYKGYIGQITNVATRIGTLKNGALRVVVYNQFTDEVRYFFLPHKVWTKFNLYKKSSGQSSIKFSYSLYDDTFSAISDYEVDNVKELAKAVNC